MSEKGKEFNLPTFGGGVNAKELAVFTRQFSVMIDAGLAAGAVPGDPGRAAGKQDLSEGADRRRERRWKAARRCPRPCASTKRSLTPLYVNLVEAGETGGILDTILQRLSSYIEKNVKLKRAVKSALVYPIAVLSVAGGRDRPAVVEGGADFRDLVPGPGREPAAAHAHRHRPEQLRRQHLRLADRGGFRRRRIGLKVWYGTPDGRMAIDAILLKLPLIGILLRKIAVARFTRTLGTLISCGVPILEGLDITARTAGNAVIEKALMKCARHSKPARIWPIR